MMLYTLERIIQRYGQRTVLDIGRLEIEAGRIHALLGPNGAGKTTLLRLLAFLEAPAAGSLRFQDRPVDFSPPALLALRRRVVLVDQHPIMFTTTVSRNIEFGLKIRGIDRTARLRIIDQALEIVGLSRYRQAAAHALSGGETQRLALARALALQPEVLLCDEPTASVDAENQAIIIDLLQQINHTRGTTILFTTHDRLQAAALAQHTLVLDNGRLATAAYENCFACTIRHLQGRLRCTLQGGIDFPLPLADVAEPMPHAGRVILDPEKLRLSREENPLTADPSFTGTVTLLMAEEAKVRVVVRIGVAVAVLLTAADYRRLAPAINDRVRLHLPAEAVSFLPEAPPD